MPTPRKHKTVQARILAYAKAIGWTIVSREEAEQRRGAERMKDEGGRMKNWSLFFDDLLDAKVREFNPRYAEAEGALLGLFRHLHSDIYGNREFPGRRSLNSRERKERREDVDGSIWRQAAAKPPGWKFWHRLCQNRLLASEHICHSLLQNSYIV